MTWNFWFNHKQNQKHWFDLKKHPKTKNQNLKRIILAKNMKNQKCFSKIDQNPKKKQWTRRIYRWTFKPNSATWTRIQTRIHEIKRHGKFINHTRINNQAIKLNNYQTKWTILSLNASINREKKPRIKMLEHVFSIN